MADPITIIGLASSIITFVEFGLKVVSGAKSIRDSQHGSTAEIHQLDLIVADVRASNTQVKEQQLARRHLSEHELRILAMVAECEKLQEELLKIIETLKVRSDARSQTLESARVFARSFFKSSDLQALRGRLDSLDARIRASVGNALQRDQHSSIMTKLVDIETSHKTMDVASESKLDLIRQDILRLTTQTQLDNDKREAIQVAQLASLRIKLDVLQREQSACARQIAVLKSLYFPELRRRWHQIREADRRSNNWIYDSEKTSFVEWLEHQGQNDTVYYITGRAGSGKSTLMKFVFEDERTMQSLKKWSGAAKLYMAAYYFWNQGTEMQKSGMGLFQSLLYQILKAAPDLIPSICSERLEHEAWEMKALTGAFEAIGRQTDLQIKFCFFIDGLDEYAGEEQDIIDLLQTLSNCGHVKICVSSRPGRQYENFLRRQRSPCDIAHFTKDDMMRYINSRLASSSNWQRLAAADPSCHDIIDQISARARGVWLWVSLVTDDIVREAERSEQVATLQRIVDNFPNDLYSYFERMISRIPALHREEMAQNFLIVMEELQPLPLYAFFLLEEERKTADYALSAPIVPISKALIQGLYPSLRDRVRNRCSDLLVIDDGPFAAGRQVFSNHSVDFLHRTVRDFLRVYEPELKKHLVKEFDPLISLSRICLGLLKALPVADFRDRSYTNEIIALTDELLYYAREVEKRRPLEDESPLVALLDELDTVNSYRARDIANHWTHARDSPPSRGLDEYLEGGRCTFLALTIQARLVKYVRAKLEADPHALLHKQGRPLLDYALRPRRSTPTSMPYHSIRDDPSLDTNMVELLLRYGADPNQPVYLNDGYSVWALFLLSIRETHGMERGGGGGSPTYRSLNEAWFRACGMLIRAGARSDCLSVSGHERVDVSTIFTGVFGERRADILREEMAQQEEQAQKGPGCLLM
ncbi:hypothetical protein BJY00DRAFT_217081 [Aspergillus carlsbadensis]|nr:hypothetical protein BJY00DRAFT_217081 [Aspergillus carlsbadensis]